MIEILSLVELAKQTGKEFENSAFKKTMYQQLFIECVHNREVLDLINEKANQYNKTYLELFKRLESDKIEYFLANAYLHKTILDRVTDIVKANDDISMTSDVLINVLLHIKILKTISDLPNSRDFKKFKLKVRANNLSDKLFLIQKKLYDLM